ncbi:MAG TPA: HlyD family secretion protein [Xanthobacteraceae bacterium]|nr:HlyD family secretion protein [Xanthobacteraceae bacterium]
MAQTLKTRPKISLVEQDEGEWIDFPPTPDPQPAPIARETKSPAPAETRAPSPTEAAPAQQDAAAPARPHRTRRVLIAGAVLAALAAAAYFGDYWWTVGRFTVTTDDAYVGAKSTTLAAKIPGYLAALEVEDNQRVRAGDVIARIDDGDYQLAVKTAQDKVATQTATIDRIGKQIAAQQAAVDQAKAQLASAQAGATRTQLELARQQALATRDFASRQTLEQAQANRDQAVAAVAAAQATLQSAAANVDVLKLQQQEAARTLDELNTALAKAERDLSFAVIRAPFDGVVGNRAVQTGDYVQPGQRLASLVPLDGVYIDANFKETQLARLRAGQTASISVDALPDRKITGTVMSFAPASGSVFTLLPPDNATGNFTKIVQRIPVRVRVPADVAGEEVLRPGMSVVVSINTKSASSETQKTAAR